MWCEPFLFTDFCGVDGYHREAYLHWLKEYKGVKDFEADLSKIEGNLFKSIWVVTITQLFILHWGGGYISSWI